MVEESAGLRAESTVDLGTNLGNPTCGKTPLLKYSTVYSVCVYGTLTATCGLHISRPQDIS